ncbi:MAG TPA: hypothetical protein VFU02_04965 [Polyangiaceae bacterium]|nr:hypothetical protein [Polyangiaceae bacterium]
MAHRRLKFVTAWLALWLVGCAESVQGTQPPRDASARPAPEPGASRAELPAALHALPDRDWQSFVSRRFGFRLPLPDAARWAEVDDAHWLTLLHRPSHSTLRLRSWRAPPRVTKQECREQVYLWRSELRPPSEPVVEGGLEAPAGYDVGVRVDLFAEAAGGRRAVALAFGASVRRCYAAYFETSLADVAESELGARLRLVTEGVFRRVEVLGVEAFAQPEPERPL